MRIYVGNLPYQITVEELREMFAAHGSVTDVHLPTDRETGRARGFGFVEMANEAEARAAMDALNGKETGGRALTVNEAQDRPQKPRGGGRERRY